MLGDSYIISYGIRLSNKTLKSAIQTRINLVLMAACMCVPCFQIVVILVSGFCINAKRSSKNKVLRAQFFADFFFLIFNFWLCGVFVAARRLLSSCGVRVFSLQLWRTGLVTPRHVGSQFPDQGSNLGPLHWKADFLPLDHQGSPFADFLGKKKCSNI